MQIGPVRITVTDGPPYGIWMRKPGGPEQDITVPSIAITAALLVLFCCCARLVF